ncbi:FAD/NAD(P)-binding protein [Amycolatopsis sp. NPDC059657]|uniref:FAD/NAD(P)-binding protein n=1 Tax=Amycolatopsis sp. NPDC059657 TaxID=3346899 RepID=UPI003672929D
MGTDQLPEPYRVVARTRETHDTVTLRLEPLGRRLPPFRAGQFMMLYAHGVGEIAISISGDPSTSDGTLEHTIRDVGAVSHALHESAPGTVLGVRGPYGTGWESGATDLVIVAGGCGLAPLRPVLLGALAAGTGHQIVLVSGARTPGDFLFPEEQESWADRVELHRTIDRPHPGWTGQVGFVTEPLERLELDPGATTALLCGPEAMIRFSAEVLLRKEIAPSDIQVSLERNMRCGIGVCGHCQLGPLLLCRDGPVVDYATAEPLLKVREL